MDVQHHRPDVPTGRGFRLEEIPVLPHLQQSGAIDLSYARTPLQLVATGEPTYYVVQRAIAGVAVAGLGLGDRFEVDLAVPFVFQQSTFAPPGYGPGATRGLGDLRLGARALLWRSTSALTAFGAGLTVGLPATGGALINEKTPWGEARLTGEQALSRVRLLGRLGYRLRGARDLYGTPLGNELGFGIGAQALVLPSTRAIVELSGATAAGDGFLGRRQTPLELNVGGRHFMGPWTFALGGGPGLAPGYGAPAYRILASLGWASVPADWDRDGVPDRQDSCPADQEDRDGFEDDDGCPDPDNDKDGLLDAADKCPNEAETRNGHEDEDGCPDTGPTVDTDGDGIADGIDKCPTEREDMDGFEDGDGCPDPDNDRDGILDASDRCPNEPETKNGFQDEDGCPDTGPTEVRVGEKELELGEAVYFDLNEARIKSRFRAVLDQVAATLKAHPEVGRCAVEGHTDDTGPEEYNRKLSVLRSQAVVKYLTETGVDPNRLSALGQGESRPWAPNETAEGRAKNRRVIFHIEKGSALIGPNVAPTPAAGRPPAGEPPSAAPPRRRPRPSQPPVVADPNAERDPAAKPPTRKRPSDSTRGTLRDLIKLPPRDPGKR